ncbi:MAG: carbohydrate ABC transporter permease [Phycisphaeraceae bacterium]
MALLGQVEARSSRGRLIHGAIILVLIVGGVTMVYPFAIMLSGSLRSEMDQADLDLVPSFWTDEAALYRKFLETKYNQDIEALNRAHLRGYFSFRDVADPRLPSETNSPDTAAAAQRLNAFVQETDLPHHWQVLGGIAGVGTVPEPLRELRRRLKARYQDDLDAFSRDVGAPTLSWLAVSLPVPAWTSRRYNFEPNALYQTYFQLLDEAPPAQRQLVSLTGAFLQAIIYPQYGRIDTAAYNAAHAVHLKTFGDFRLPATVPGPDQPRLRGEWIEFVTKELHPSFITLAQVSQADYDAFLQQAFEGETRWPLPDGHTWLSGAQREAYERFLETRLVEHYVLVGPEYLFGQAELPHAVAALEYQYARDHATALRGTYSIRNYLTVLDELVFQGRPLINTVIFCFLAISAALLINPLAAYALSRYQLPGTYKVLLFLMATIAFPPMVTLIPQFILLRKLHLLNTFFALMLPLMANGYMIFLLKGFFDSLPRELYEAARIDGASEMRMFFQITMALSKPILAVLALGTFTHAYLMFLYPLLVAPDQDMWLISVWLFQYQQRASSAGIYASIILASIPTLLIFLFAQRTIMRGIVVPTEK